MGGGRAVSQHLPGLREGRMQGGNPGSWDVAIEKTRSSSLRRGPNSPAFRLGLRLPFPPSGRGKKRRKKKERCLTFPYRTCCGQSLSFLMSRLLLPLLPPCCSHLLQPHPFDLKVGDAFVLQTPSLLLPTPWKSGSPLPCPKSISPKAL